MNELNRREALGSMAASMMLGNAIAIEPKAKRITLGFSNYGMKTLANFWHGRRAKIFHQRCKL